MPRPRGPKRPRISPAEFTLDPAGLGAWMLRFLEWKRIRNYSTLTVTNSEVCLDWFLTWCRERGLTRPGQITRPILQRYQRHLFLHRKRDGAPLSFQAQRNRLQPVQAYFKWLTRQNVIPSNPASELEMPRLGRRLPKHVLSVDEVEAVLARPDLAAPLGLRDRAILEVLYSSGMRRAELTHLAVFDLDLERGTVMIRQGKGKKDRMVPLGERAAVWCLRYLQEVRPSLVVEPDEGYVFLTLQGLAHTPSQLTRLVRQYVDQADLGKRGSCHLFRHACATAMLEGGADVRFIQEMLGHASLETTQIYAQVSIKKLKEIHAATHPGAKLAKPEPPAPPGLVDPSTAAPPAATEPPTPSEPELGQAEADPLAWLHDEPESEAEVEVEVEAEDLVEPGRPEAQAPSRGPRRP